MLAYIQDADWYRATTLRERISLSQKPNSDCQGGENIVAIPRLERWRSEPPFDNASLFAQRLTSYGITEMEFCALLGEPPDSLCARFSDTPLWLREFLLAFASAPELNTALFNAELKTAPAGGFLKLVEPLLAHGLGKFRDSAAALIREFPDAPFDSGSFDVLFFSNLPQQLLAMLKRTLVLELNVARLEGLLDGATPEDRFRSFTERVRRPDIRAAILREYPVLARQLAEHVDRSSLFLLEFIGRLCGDWEGIRNIFMPGNNPGVLVHAETEAGDRHRNGRSVVVCTFSSGFRLVYKPKRMSVDLHFQELVTWFNERGLSPILPILQILDRDSYGWVEFVAAESCKCEMDLSRFYERQGAYLALLYLLAATDFHCENLIAVGDNPFLIDLEAMFQPDPPQTRAEDETWRLIQSTVQRVGLLPLRFGATAEHGGVDFTGLGGAAGQVTPYAVPGWEGEDTDEMRMVRKPATTSAAQNRPRLDGSDVCAFDHAEEITAGFARAYQLILKHRDELLDSEGPLSWFADDEVRVILRPTATYYTLLSESFHPDVLRDALDRQQLLDRLWVAVEDAPHLAKVISTEQQDLQHGDIPLFTTRPSSRDLWTSSGQLIPNFFDECSLTVVRRRLQNLCERDLSLQLWLIEASLATSTEYAMFGQESSHRTTAQPKAMSHDRLLSSARVIGDKLESMAFHAGHDISWIGLMPGEPSWSISPSMLDLYSGLPGIALFLAYLGATAGERRYRILAEQTCESMLRRLEEHKSSLASVGAFSGWGGVIYALTHLGALWCEPELLDRADAIVATLAQLIRQDEHLDLIAGTAGCLGALLSFHDQLPSKMTLDVAVQCGQRLIASAQPQEHGVGWVIPRQSTPLAGFAHGAGGIAWALLRLAAVTQDERLRTIALAGIAYERSLFSQEAGNWHDLRVRTASRSPSNGNGNHFMTAWCNGAPGIGLARLCTLELLDDTATRREIDVALETTLRLGFGQNHCLCHGDLGSVELLLHSDKRFDDPRLCSAVDSVACTIVDSIAENKVLCGTPMSVATPGLMIGLAGIGYGLLRLAQPQRVPSILTLEPPRRNWRASI